MKFNNGFLYPIIDLLIEGLQRLNSVEWLKFVAKRLFANNGTEVEKRRIERISVDAFIIIKFLIVITMWLMDYSSILTNWLVFYLICSNLLTYFYYHVWGRQAFDKTNWSIDRVKRKFLNLGFALLFSNVSFAYLYEVPFKNHFEWKANDGGNSSALQALWFSISNSVAANYSDVLPKPGLANNLCMVQLTVTFVFVAIIISRTIPEPE